MPEICFKCQSQIPAQTPIATFESHTYHTECLSCKFCRKSVSGQKFVKDKEQNLICEKCDFIHGPKCKRCRTGFKPGQPYKKLDENTFYHNECFTCIGPCKKPIGAEFYDNDDGEFICSECGDKYGVRNNYDDIVCSNTSKNSSIPEATLGGRPQSNEDNKRGNYNSQTNQSRNYDNSNRSSIPEAVLGAKPPSKYDDDNDVNTLSSTFTVKLNTASPSNNRRNNDNNPRFDNKPSSNSRFDSPTNSSSPRERKNRFDDNNNNRTDNSNSSKSSLVCNKCGLAIQGTYSVYENKNYHARCFTCNRCNKEFKERQFFKLDGYPVCADCHEENLLSTSTKCRNCNKPILDTKLTFMGGEYHEYCLTCTTCNKKLVGVSIYTDKQSKPHCVDCFTKNESKRCSKCYRPIAPNQPNIIFEDKPYHQECFTCFECRRLISADESFFKRENGEIICDACLSQPSSSF